MTVESEIVKKNYKKKLRRTNYGLVTGMERKVVATSLYRETGFSQGSLVGSKTRRILEVTPEQVNRRTDVMVC